MRQGYWSLVWAAFLAVNGVLVGMVTLILSFFFWIVVPTGTVPVKVFVPILVGLALIITTLFQSTRMALQRAQDLPQVRAALHSGQSLVLLLDSSGLFSHDSLVSIYYLDPRNFEVLVGMGAVTNVQRDGRIQVTVLVPISGQEETLASLKSNDRQTLERTIVKPNVPRAYATELSAGGT